MPAPGATCPRAGETSAPHRAKLEARRALGRSRPATALRDTAAVDNAALADRLHTLAGLLALSEANPHSVRAYRRAADAVRAAAVPVADLVRAGRARELPGIGRG